MIKTFKEHLINESVSGLVSIGTPIDYVVNYSHYGNIIPIVGSFISKNFKTEKKAIGYHVCDYENFKRLIKIQNSQKSISVTLRTNYNDVKDSLFDTGILTQVDVIAKLEGNLIGHWITDVHSLPDNQGRRWVSIRNMFKYEIEAWAENNWSKKTRYFFMGDIGEIIDKKMFVLFTILLNTFSKTYPEFDELYKKAIKESWLKGFTDIGKFPQIYNTMEQSIGNDANLKKIFNKFKERLIATYVSAIQGIMIKHKEEFQEFLLSYDYVKDGDRTQNYDEGLMSKFKIKEVLYIDNELYPTDLSSFRKDMKVISDKIIADFKRQYPKYPFEEKKGVFVHTGTYFLIAFDGTKDENKSPEKNDAKLKKLISDIEKKYDVVFSEEYSMNSNADKFYRIAFLKKIEKQTLIDRLKVDGITSNIPKITTIKNKSSIVNHPFFKV